MSKRLCQASRRALCGWAPLACGAALAWRALAGESPKPITLEQVPAAARKTIQQEADSATIKDIQPDQQDGEATFIVSFIEAGQTRQLTVAATGALRSREVALEEAPRAVRKTILDQARGGAIESIAKTFENDEIFYEVAVRGKEGKEHSFAVGPEGKLLQVDLSLEEVPAPVRKTIETNLGGSKLESVAHMFEEDGNTYYVEFTRNGKERDLSIGEDGKLQEMEVFLEELSPAAQRTIKEKLGDGALVRIDKSFEPREGGFPYEVEGRKEGKPFNFSVSARGAFLGMDDD